MLRTLIRVGQICITQVKPNNGKPSVLTAMALHIKARCEIYPRTEKLPVPIRRFPVPDDKVLWLVNFQDYKPVEYTSDVVKKKPDWSDPDYNKSDTSEYKRLQFNSLDGKVNRCSHEKEGYSIQDDYPLLNIMTKCVKYKKFKASKDSHDSCLTGTKCTSLATCSMCTSLLENTRLQYCEEKKNPVRDVENQRQKILMFNPRGRTGIKGRGCLGRWGPNHAADPIVTRWKTDENGDIEKGKDGKRKLQFVCVERKDNGEWAIPGGMVNAGEVVTSTLRREFGEEALNTMEMSPEEKKAIMASIDECFKNGKEVYRGYVDDPRNTDNAWMETVAYNFHDETGDSVGKLKLHAGDDAVGVQWMTISQDLKLYASHYDFIKKVVDKHDASW